MDRREAENARRGEELQARLEKPEVRAEITAKTPACLREDQARLERLATVETRLSQVTTEGQEISRLFNTASFRTWEQRHALCIRGDVQDLRNILDQSGDIARQMTHIQQMQVAYEGPSHGISR